MTIKKHIPNFFSLLNLFSGCVALVYVVKWNFEMAFFYICLGIFFDFLDGMLARILKVSSPLGVQLDSLADMVTCGVVPGYVIYTMFKLISFDYNSEIMRYLPVIGFLITVASCYRLAKFNIDTRQQDSFIGLPTPANAIFIVSLALIKDNYILSLLQSPYVLTAISIFSAYILNAEIPLFSLKFKKFNFQDNKLQIIFALLSVLFLIVLKTTGVPLIIVLYIIMSVVNNKFLKTSKA